jgi:hypothetical protein
MGEYREDVLSSCIPAGTRAGVGVGALVAQRHEDGRRPHRRGYYTQINPDEPVAGRGFDCPPRSTRRACSM